MNKILKLTALANFLRLGVANTSSYQHLKKWLSYQKSLQGILTAQSLDQFRLEQNTASREIDLEHRFFITAHYGIYPMINKYLCTLFPDRKIICLVGQQKTIQSLIQLSHLCKLNIEYVEVGTSLIFFRKLIKLNKQGCVFLSLIDVPLGVSDKNNVTLPFLNGNILAKAGLLKIAAKLKLPIRFLLTEFEKTDSSVPVHSYSVDNLEDIFDIFAAQVSNKPYLWDKIVDVSHFYQSNIESGTYIPFKLDGEFCAFDLSNNQILKINQQLYRKLNQLKIAETSASEHFEIYKRQINEQTNLCIQRAV